MPPLQVAFPEATAHAVALNLDCGNPIFYWMQKRMDIIFRHI
jgi:hypothetical protein